MTTYQSIPLPATKRIALVAHDHKKDDLLDWARHNCDLLKRHTLFATGSTGALLERELGLAVTRFNSGPLGGDQQIGARIAERQLDMLIFFWDPLEPLSHDPDIKALLRVAVVWNIPMVCNRATADFVVSSALMEVEYNRLVPEYEKYKH